MTFQFFQRLEQVSRITLVLVVFSVGVALFNTSLYLLAYDSKETIVIQTPTHRYPLRVDVASSSEDRARGLMGVTDLPEGEGMLFVYDESRYVAFWMKNMLMTIDMIFVGSDMEIKHIEHEAYPCFWVGAVCPRIIPPVKVQYVLEVPAGYVQKHQIITGDRLILK